MRKDASDIPKPRDKEMKNYTLAVYIHVEAESLQDAYAQIYNLMGNPGPKGFVDWESTDEAYVEGNPIYPEELENARRAFFDAHDKRWPEENE